MVSAEQLFDRVRAQMRSGLPFVIYRLPDQDALKGLFQLDAEIYKTEDYKENGFVFAPFNTEEPAVILPLSESEVLRSGPYQGVINRQGSFEDLKINSPEKPVYISKVSNAVQAIHHSELEKVVLSRVITCTMGIDKIMSFQNLLALHAGALVYWFFHPEVGEWMGATPELLLSVKKRSLETVSLAGTKAAESTHAVNWSSKEIHEQQLVTDFIIENIRPITSGLIVSEQQTVRAGDLYHLKTRITADIIKGTGRLRDIVKALHPTPAVCGLPRQNALKYIQDNEGYDRKFYTGFLGELNMEEIPGSELFVNLRCMELTPHGIKIYVGGGITADSIPADEWVETVNKSKTILNAIVFSATE